MTPDELRAPKTVKAWHFVRENRTLGYGDKRKVEAGWTYYDDCETPVLCEVGLHGSRNILDALSYAPGSVCCLVEIGGVIVEDHDKLAGTKRTVLAMADATDVLRKFARLCALDVVFNWDAPDVVLRWLKTGDKSLRSDAGRAADSAARSAAESAACLAAESAACSAVRSAACSAAESAADSAAYSSARSAACLAAYSSARSAARLAAESAACSAVRKKQAARLTRMMNRLLKCES